VYVSVELFLLQLIKDVFPAGARTAEALDSAGPDGAVRSDLAYTSEIKDWVRQPKILFASQLGLGTPLVLGRDGRG
jgi:hypothetical protein